jgi:hypothetical protein
MDIIAFPQHVVEGGVSAVAFGGFAAVGAGVAVVGA